MEDAELKARIEELAQLQFSDRQIATIVQLSPQDVVERFSMEIDRGRLLAEAEVRRAVLQLAKQGSTPAQKQFQAYSQQANKTRLARTPSK